MIRRARREDIAAITAIYRHAVLEGTGTFEIEPPDVDEMTLRHARLTDAGYPFLVAEASGGVEGYAYAAAYHHRQAFGFTVEDSVYVAAKSQGRGIGLNLLDALVVEATARGFRQMVAVIGDSDNQASIQLHSRAGFAPAGVIGAVGWKHGRWLDAVLMQKPLGDGSASPAT